MTIISKVNALLFSAFFLLSVGAEAGADVVVASVSGKSITEATLDARIKANAQGGMVDDANRPAALRQLVLEAAADAVVAPAAMSDSVVRTELARQRGQALLQLYYGQVQQVGDVTQADRDAYVRAHPELFGGRRTYHFAEVNVLAAQAAAVRQMRDRVDQFLRAGNYDFLTMQSAFSWAQPPVYIASVSKNWLGSEQVDKASLPLIDRLSRTPGQIDVDCRGSRCRLTIVYASFADPANPDLLQGVIKAAILAERLENQRNDLESKLIRSAGVKIFDSSLSSAFAADQRAASPAPLATRMKLLAAVQLINLVAALAALVWLVRKSAPEKVVTAERNNVVLAQRLPLWLRVTYGKAVTLSVAAILAPVLLGSSAMVLIRTGMTDRPQEAAVIGVLALAVIGGAAVAIRLVPLIRSIATMRRVGLGVVLATQIFLLTKV